MDTQTQEMSLQELVEALRGTNQKGYDGTSDFGFNVERERRSYEQKISKLIKKQHPELNDRVVGIRLEIERILVGIRQNDPLIIAEYVQSALAA